MAYPLQECYFLVKLHLKKSLAHLTQKAAFALGKDGSIHGDYA